MLNNNEAMSEMNWNNLKDMACPKCTGKLEKSKFGYQCIHDIGYKPCDFKISFTRFEEILYDLYKKKQRRQFREIGEEENLQGLSNL